MIALLLLCQARDWPADEFSSVLSLVVILQANHNLLYSVFNVVFLFFLHII